jgi:hypothetical protein
MSALRTLSLRGCAFLRGEFIVSLRRCTSLEALDLAGCALGLHLNAATAAALAAMAGLRALDVSGTGNGVTDGVVEGLSCMKSLR